MAALQGGETAQHAARVIAAAGHPARRWGLPADSARCWAVPGAGTHQPSLHDGYSGVLCDSLDIAQWADDHSNRHDGVKLLPAHQLEDIKR